MKLEPTPIEGAFVLEPEPHADARGSFARVFCKDELAARGLEMDIAQASLSHNPIEGTLRGMHLQVAPHEEIKIVGCIAGALYDVLLDLREGSPSFGRWWAVDLAPPLTRLVYIPRGVAHGFMTRAPDTTVSYWISAPYAPAAARGVRFDDPRFGIVWPGPPAMIGERDRSFPDYGPW